MAFAILGHPRQPAPAHICAWPVCGSPHCPHDTNRCDACMDARPTLTRKGRRTAYQLYAPRHERVCHAIQLYGSAPDRHVGRGRQQPPQTKHKTQESSVPMIPSLALSHGRAMRMPRPRVSLAPCGDAAHTWQGCMPKHPHDLRTACQRDFASHTLPSNFMAAHAWWYRAPLPALAFGDVLSWSVAWALTSPRCRSYAVATMTPSTLLSSKRARSACLACTRARRYCIG